jgi:hypothetical protein
MRIYPPAEDFHRNQGSGRTPDRREDRVWRVRVDFRLGRQLKSTAEQAQLAKEQGEGGRP